MGQVAMTLPRVVLQTDVQLFFKDASVKDDVAEIVKGWFEDGAPLGLNREVFEQVMRLGGRGDPFFDTFDSDKNQKVDAFEALAAAIILGDGTIDDKLEVIFPVFDFSGNGRLNFDEANIFIHSVCRGLHKVCGMQHIKDEAIVELCKQMFDAHNLPYSKQVTKEQVRRWLRNDIEAAKFLDAFHNSFALQDVEAALANLEQAQAAVFSNLCGTASSMPVDNLLRNDEFRMSLGNPDPESVRSFLGIVTGSGSRTVEPERFAEAARAWNVFGAVDVPGEGEMDAKELGNLMRLQQREEPSPEAISMMQKSMGLSSDDRLARHDWVVACLKFLNS